ncbi:lycopene cyclase domain-containing protein [Dyadobacter aurulentus]|uniref:lycopene cyclase domain-containing protein n=1 Tax=Dyadobacter sp. UC 10 TaxID=2605428 RepID=UPI0011F21935|nr:lycopene cyclase domain-containing protein [Dyadobacter sp. UC 10]KAA0992522.1 lycopene cyclase domain-containing protein [Dyadobacter sp. UC 10]
MNSLYLLIDLASISIPILASFHPKIGLSKHWPVLWPAILLSALPFIVWDSFFTKIGVWGFTPKYLLGIYLLDLPIEEILFFICIPYACIFTYYTFRVFLSTDYRIRAENFVLWLFIIVSAAAAVLFYDRAYTLSTSVLLTLFLLYLKFYVKAKWLSLFLYSHMFLLIPFIIVNGILTGTGLDEPIVWYNDAENVGVRFLTIPVEDLFYGMLMLLLNTFLFEKLLARRTLTTRIS